MNPANNVHLQSIAAAVLAAGASTRMGRPKQTLPFRGRPMVRAVAQNALASSARPVLVVVGSDAAAVEDALVELPVEIVRNFRWREGLGSSIRAALAHVREHAPDADGLLLLLGDQPLVGPAAIERIVAEYRRDRAAAVATDRNGLPGVPALFSPETFDDLWRLGGDTGARQLLADLSTRIRSVRIPEADRDVDTPEDYRLLIDSAG